MSDRSENTWGIIAEFPHPSGLLNAAKALREKGYRKYDTHSPFPIHGMDSAMGLRRSKLGFIVAVFAAAGAVAGITLQWWTSTIAYPYVMSGKLLFSWQAFIIVTFALFVLFGAFASLFGMLFLNRLPRLFHPLFFSDNFKRVTDDGFFISIEAKDPLFDPQATGSFLESLGGQNVEVLREN